MISDPDAPIALYHGTTLENARRIAAVGLWAPSVTDVHVSLRELEAFYGAESGAASREHIAGIRGLELTEVCLSTGWKLAANFASRGPEYFYLGLCGIAESLAVDESWVRGQLAHVPAVVTIVAPRSEIAARITAPDRVTDELLDPGVHPIGAALGIANEIRLAGPLPAAWVAAIDELAAPCRCDDVRDGDRCPRCPKKVEGSGERRVR
ncbi:MAG: hypothetical protein ACRDYF_16565 [Acidimicrobiia bacterium]